MSTDPAMQATPSQADGDGIRVIPHRSAGRRWSVLGTVACVLSVGILAGVWLSSRQPDGAAGFVEVEPVPGASVAPQTPPVRAVQQLGPQRAPAPRVAVPEPQESPEDYDLPSLDPDDIAAYIRPGDEEPTAAELIEALREAGIHEGIAAFNPPGTSPPLEGLAVPDDFELPEGYVRHHQVTDEGEPIEPILMFSPDYEYYDEQGRMVELPADLVVPEDLAPPSLPIRRVRVPPP